MFRSRKSVRRPGEVGASAVEYGLLVAAIAAVIALIVFAFGGLVSNLFDSSCNTFDQSNTAHGGTAASC